MRQSACSFQKWLVPHRWFDPYGLSSSPMYICTYCTYFFRLKFFYAVIKFTAMQVTARSMHIQLTYHRLLVHCQSQIFIETLL